MQILHDDFIVLSTLQPKMKFVGNCDEDDSDGSHGS